ncbi:MAG: glycosyltransferase family 39 protein [Desulforhopalus sp.]|nr:glycosyltransferase family 39 protein [Desulforhopalus sp.]
MNRETTAHSQRNDLPLPFLLALFGYFALHIALRVAVSGSLDYDEAEQALLGQWLLAGYTEQPPLYTWVQYLLFGLFGKNVFAVSLLKNGLLLCTYISVFFAAREILHDHRRAILATLSLLFIPQIAWESQRDMTHTTLVVFAAAATLWQVLRLIRKQSVTNYCIFGLLLGMGVLGKANFFLFLTVLLLTLLSFSEGRKVLISQKILVSLLIAAAVTSIYAVWMINNQDIVFSATHKFKRAVENYWQKGVISLFTNSFLFLTPLWLIWLLIFPQGFRPTGPNNSGFHRQFIGRYLLLLFFCLLVVVIVGKVTYVKDRWLQPLLFIAPIYFFARLSPGAISQSRFKLFLRIAAAVALVIYLAFAMRVVGASYINRFCRMNYPFAPIAEDMRRLGFAEGLIISDDRFIAGNLHFQFPTSTALVPEYHFERLVDPASSPSIAVVWETANRGKIPSDLKEYLEKTFNLPVTDFPVHYLEHIYLFGRTETVTLAFTLLPLPGNKVELSSLSAQMERKPLRNKQE